MASEQQSPVSASSRVRFWLVALVMAALLGAGAWYLFFTAADVQDTKPGKAESPYTNTRPSVRYVGDAACASCHQSIAKRYATHPMGRSLTPIAHEPLLDGQGGARAWFVRDGIEFVVERQDDRVIHREIQRDGKGNVLADTSAEVHFAMGSGRQGRSYLINRDGLIFQSSISWFTSKKAWDLSPGFERNQEHFFRPVGPACLSCHVNAAAPVEHTINRYQEPVFRGQAIGCERCHGPGEQHVAARQKGPARGAADYTIVNPRHLEPTLREAVCQQCHLQGETRLARYGKGFFDYRPGLPLHDFVAVFAQPPELADGGKSVSHVEQMELSRCYKESGGRLGCISCHEPHELPAQQRRVAHYRGQCLSCHSEQACVLAPAERIAKAPGDSCIDCHLPRRSSTNIAHVAVTDHRIIRSSARIRSSAGAPRANSELVAGQVPLLDFHRHVRPADDDINRERGLAIITVGRQKGLNAQQIAARAYPLLDAAVRTRPDDVAAWEALGYALWRMQRPVEAMNAFETALRLAPDLESALYDAAQLATELQRGSQALEYRERLIKLNPWRPLYHFRLAMLHSDRNDVARAALAAKAALAVHPGATAARAILVWAHMERGEENRAEEEFAILMQLNPPQPEQLRAWFAELKNRKR